MGYDVSRRTTRVLTELTRSRSVAIAAAFAGLPGGDVNERNAFPPRSVM